MFPLGLSTSRRKIYRRLAVATFVVSVATFAASIIFWVRGSSRLDELSFNRFDGPSAFHGVWQVKRHHFTIDSTRGRIGLLFTRVIDTGRERDSDFLARLDKPIEWRQWRPSNLLDNPPNEQLFNKLGFFIGVERNDTSDFKKDPSWAIFGSSIGRDDFWIVFPNWALAVLSLLFGWISFPNMRGPFRRGRCANCGYDLRATRDRCPECGTASQHESALKPT